MEADNDVHQIHPALLVNPELGHIMKLPLELRNKIYHSYCADVSSQPILQIDRQLTQGMRDSSSLLSIVDGNTKASHSRYFR